MRRTRIRPSTGSSRTVTTAIAAPSMIAATAEIGLVLPESNAPVDTSSTTPATASATVAASTSSSPTPLSAGSLLRRRSAPTGEAMMRRAATTAATTLAAVAAAMTWTAVTGNATLASASSR